MDYHYFEIDVSVDNPRDYPAVDSPIDLEDILVRLRQAKVWAPTNWSTRPKSFAFRSMRSEDEDMIIRAVAAAHNTLRNQVYHQLADGGDYEVISETLVSVHFGCVTSKWLVVLAFIGLTADGITISDLPNRFGKASSPIIVECSPHITGAPEVGYHIQTILKNSPAELFKSSCTQLRQRALKYGGYYSGNVDGAYGKLTARAEMNAASHYKVDETNLVRLYGALADDLNSKSYRASSDESLPNRSPS